MPLLETRPRAIALAALAALVTLLLLPGAGQAAVRFGALRTTNDPNASGCGMLGACTLISYINPVDPNGDPYAGGSPVDGVITTFSIRATAVGGPAQITFRVGDVSRPNAADTGSAVGAVTATGPTVPIPVALAGYPVPVLRFAARVPVARGQHIAIDNPGAVNAVYASGGSPFTYAFAPLLADGQPAIASSDVTEELLVSATVEPDADRDGFGDETQDGCPTDAARHGSCSGGGGPVTPPPTAHTISGLRVSAGRIRYTLSVGAAVELQLAKRAGGRRAGGRCVRPTRRNAAKPRCVRFVKVGNPLAGGSSSGDNAVRLPKPHGRRLRAGVYRVTATAHFASDQQASATARFTIARRTR